MGLVAHLSNYSTSLTSLAYVPIFSEIICYFHIFLLSAEKELFEFLSEEIQAEKKIQKSQNIPSEIDGFQVKLDGPEVTLEKSVDNEKIEINFNVNHSVDADAEPQIDPSMNEPEIEMKSKPQFEVNFTKGKTTLGFTCSFIPPESEASEEGYSKFIAHTIVTIITI